MVADDLHVISQDCKLSEYGRNSRETNWILHGLAKYGMLAPLIILVHSVFRKNLFSFMSPLSLLSKFDTHQNAVHTSKI
jgi:hypothetical protein